MFYSGVAEGGGAGRHSHARGGRRGSFIVARSSKPLQLALARAAPAGRPGNIYPEPGPARRVREKIMECKRRRAGEYARAHTPSACGGQRVRAVRARTTAAAAAARKRREKMERRPLFGPGQSVSPAPAGRALLPDLLPSHPPPSPPPQQPASSRFNLASRTLISIRDCCPRESFDAIASAGLIGPSSIALDPASRSFHALARQLK